MTVTHLKSVAISSQAGISIEVESNRTSGSHNLEQNKPFIIAGHLKRKSPGKWPVDTST